MEDKQFMNEKRYLATMSVAKSLLMKGIISEEEYSQIDTIFQEKYQPSLGTLFSDIRLIKLENRGVMDTDKEG